MKSGRYTIRWSHCERLDFRTWWAHAVTIGTEVYVCGGNTKGTQSEDVFMYHTLENTWRTLPQPGVYYAVPVSIKDRLILIGGRSRGRFWYKFSAKVLTFDVSSQSWIKEFPDLLTGRSRPGVVAASHFLIVAGGKVTDRPQFSNDIEFLDTENSPLRWKRSVIKLPTHMWDLTVFSSEEYFWIISYGDGDRHRNIVHRIAITDIVSSAKKEYKWEPLPETIRWKSKILSSNGCLPILLGGENKEYMPSDAICYYDDDTGMWKENQVATLSMPKAFPAVSLVGQNAVMVIGGCSSSKAEESEEYSVTSVEIGILEIKC